MRVLERIQNLNYSKENNILIASGRQGGIYSFDLNLSCIAASPRSGNNIPISAILEKNGYVFTRNILGTIQRWRLPYLEPTDALYSETIQGRNDDEMEETVRSVSHGLAYWNDNIYAISGTGQLLELDLEDLKVRRIFNPSAESFIESIEVSKDELHLLSDFSGWIWHGHLSDGDFKKLTRIDAGPCHHLAYDRLHNRYWATTDNQGGFVLIDGKSLEAKLIRMTTDDVEWIDFDATGKTAYVACFDHYLYIYNNEFEEPKMQAKIGPFKFQLKQVISVGVFIFVLLESGEIIKIDENGSIILSSTWQGNCIWGLTPDTVNNSNYYCSLEDGSIRQIEVDCDKVGIISLRETKGLFFPYGRLRRVLSLPDGDLIAISTSGVVFRTTANGYVIWENHFFGIGRDLSLHPNGLRLAVANESGEAQEIDIRNGLVIRRFNTGEPTWSVCYLEDGRLLLGLRRRKIYVYDENSIEPINALEFIDNVKGIRQLKNGRICVNGPGGITLYNPTSLSPIRSYSDGITTTCESVACTDSQVFAVSYDLSLNTFDYDSSELLDQQFPFFDFPKVIHFHQGDSMSLLLAAGRGPCLTAFRLFNGKPIKVREVFLSLPKTGQIK